MLTISWWRNRIINHEGQCAHWEPVQHHAPLVLDVLCYVQPRALQPGELLKSLIPPQNWVWVSENGTQALVFWKSSSDHSHIQSGLNYTICTNYRSYCAENLSHVRKLMLGEMVCAQCLATKQYFTPSLYGFKTRGFEIYFWKWPKVGHVIYIIT